jgi:lysophospholipase L1-like esterase
LVAHLTTDNPNCSWGYTNDGVNGATVATTRLAIDGYIASETFYQSYVLINLGVNDMTSMPTETQFKEDYQYIIDAIKAEWPQIVIYMAKPWKRGFDTEADTVAGWIDSLITTNSGICFAGHDERVWLKWGADNGYTRTLDGIHYNTAGAAEAINQWVTVFGY